MRVLFDAYWFIAGPPSQRHVLREMVSSWIAEFPGDEVGLVVRAKHLAEARAELDGDIAVFPSRAYPQALLASTHLSRIGRRWNADVVVAHNYTPRYRRGISAVFLHDVLFLDNPEWFTKVERLYFGVMPWLAPRADIVFTSSATEADRIRRRTRSRDVVPVGIGLSRELIESAPLDALDGDLAHLRPQRYVLAVGRLNVRKNLARVISACLSTGALTPENPLVIVGSGDGRAEDHRPELRSAVDSGAVIFAGFVTDQKLRWLYENSSCMVFASLGEGFGMPPVEAAFFGTEIVVSDLPVFRETVGDTAFFVDPLSEESIGSGIRAAISAAQLRGGRRPVSDWVRRFNWKTSVGLMRSAVEAKRRERGQAE